MVPSSPALHWLFFLWTCLGAGCGVGVPCRNHPLAWEDFHSDLKIMQDLFGGFAGTKILLVPWKWLAEWHSAQNPAEDLG